MDNPLILVPLVLWLFTYGINSFFRHMLKKKLGTQSEGYVDFKLPYFLSNLLNSMVSVGLMLIIMNCPVPYQFNTYLLAPYFGIISYCTTGVFRALKNAGNS